MSLDFEIVSYDEFRKAIQPLRPWQTEYIHTPIINNPYGMIQYCGQEAFDRILYFPVCAKLDGEAVGYTCIYNASDTVVRFISIYVKPEARGQGIGPQMCEYGLSLWPRPWNKLIGYYMNVSIDSFRSWGIKEFPEHYWRPRNVLLNAVTMERMPYKIVLVEKHFNDD